MKLLWQGFGHALAAFACLLAGTGFAAGQTQTTGRITGTVKDQRQALIVRAQVSVVSLETGEQRDVQTGT
jgi:hypothetical protein